MKSQFPHKPAWPVGQQEYRNCVIKLESSGPNVLGSAIAEGERIAQCVDTHFDDAVQRLRSMIDDYYVERMAARGNRLPTDGEYRTALKDIDVWLTPLQKRILQKHVEAADYLCSVEDVLDVTKTHSTIRLLLNYSSIARRLSDALSFIPGLNGPAIDPIVAVLMTPTGVMSTTRTEARTLQLQPKVGKALEVMDGYRFTENFS